MPEWKKYIRQNLHLRGLGPERGFHGRQKWPHKL